MGGEYRRKELCTLEKNCILKNSTLFGVRLSADFTKMFHEFADELVPVELVKARIL